MNTCHCNHIYCCDEKLLEAAKMALLAIQTQSYSGQLFAEKKLKEVLKLSPESKRPEGKI